MSGPCTDISVSGRAGALPEWFRQPLPDPAALARMRGLLEDTGMHTVCTEARCPNLGQCWNRGHATFMILGGTCTRACRFCAVSHGRPQEPDENEPWQVARAVRHLGLRYVVLTSVTRDDLPDEGAWHFARTIRAVRFLNRTTRIELLIPDFSGREDCLRVVLDAGPDVLGHNLETVRRLSPRIRSRSDHQRSLEVLRMSTRLSPGLIVKSGLMVGLGETDEEIVAELNEIRRAGALIATVGQYLPPLRGVDPAPVARFVPPETFEVYRREGLRAGLKAVLAGPLVRSSYMADEAYRICRLSIEGKK